MKKLLAFSIALIMVISMLPTTFAAVDTETGAITYEFVAEGSTIAVLEDVNGVKNSTYTVYDSENGRDWAYLGTNWSATTSIISMAYGETGSLRCGANSGQNSWVAFKIRVPVSATYNVSGTAYNYENGSAAMTVYIAPMNELFLEGTKVYGTVSDGKRTGATSFTELGIENSAYVGKTNIQNTSETSVKSITWTDGPNTISMNAGEDYLLIFNQGENNNRALTPASITLTPEPKEYTYHFNRSVLTSDITSKTDFKAYYRPFYYTDASGNACYDKNFLSDIDAVVDTTTGSEKWAVSSLGGPIGKTSVGYKATSSITDSYLQMIGKKTLTHIDTSGDGRFVLELNVPSVGSYDITAELGEYQYGADADIYIIKKTDSITEISHQFLKNYPIVGRIGNATGRLDGDVGNYTFESAGSYYFVFSFNSENVTAAASSRQYFNLKSITLSEGEAEVEIPGTAPEETPSFVAATNIPEKTVTVTGAGDGSVYSVARGTAVTLALPEVEGYNFIGWVRGAYDNDGEISKLVDLTENENGTYSYTVWTNTYLTAVYEPETVSDGKVVRFWNDDRTYLGEKKVSELDAENLPAAARIGHNFTGWLIAEDEALDIENLTADVTNAVAQYEKNQYATYTSGDEVTLNGATQNNNKLFGSHLECSDANGTVTHWLRDGKIVSYDSVYNHYVWDGTHIHSSYAAVTPKPLVVLESTTIDGAYMIEYEAPAGYEIAEVGILFGTEGTTPDINSALDRASSQLGLSRGQFAEMPSDESYTVARGYMIYEDTDGSFKVIYSD